MTMNEWPSLPYESWVDTRDTLHMYAQVVGKLRLALSPFEPEWANVPLYVTARGLTTSPMPVGRGTIDAEFDLLDHALLLRASGGEVERRPLGAPVAEFYADTMSALRRMGVEVSMSTMPSEVADAIPFPDDRVHVTYQADHVSRFFQVLSAVDVVLKQHRAGFRGRTTPVQFFWGTFDLAVTRYSGRPMTPPAGAGSIDRFGGDAEEVCAGWWPGSPATPYPAFYAYAAPPPQGIAQIPIAPAGATWSDAAGEFLLPYAVARESADPARTALDFLGTTYAGAADLLQWDSTLTDVAIPKSRSRVTSSSVEART